MNWLCIIAFTLSCVFVRTSSFLTLRSAVTYCLRCDSVDILHDCLGSGLEFALCNSEAAAFAAKVCHRYLSSMSIGAVNR